MALTTAAVPFVEGRQDMARIATAPLIRVRIIKDTVAESRRVKAGDVLALAEAEALALVSMKRAVVVVESPQPEPAAAEPQAGAPGTAEPASKKTGRKPAPKKTG